MQSDSISTEAMSFRKRPVVIQAMRIESSSFDHLQAVVAWIGNKAYHDGEHVFIYTLEGKMGGSIGDWIIRGVKGEHYLCKPDIFEATYEPASSPEPADELRKWLLGECQPVTDQWDAGYDAAIRAVLRRFFLTEGRWESTGLCGCTGETNNGRRPFHCEHGYWTKMQQPSTKTAVLCPTCKGHQTSTDAGNRSCKTCGGTGSAMNGSATTKEGGL